MSAIFATILNRGKRVFAQPMSVIMFFISRAQTPISHEKPSPAPLIFNLKNWIRQPQRRRPCGPAWRPPRKGGEGLGQEQEGGGKETAISAGGERRERGVRRERESISALLGTQTLQKLEIWSMSSSYSAAVGTTEAHSFKKLSTMSITTTTRLRNTEDNILWFPVFILVFRSGQIWDCIPT